MANVKVELDHQPYDGMSLTFKAPCDCDNITGLLIHYEDDINVIKYEQVFTFRDTHGNDLSNINELFKAGAYVKVVLHIAPLSNYAYIQNADTNGYLEGKFAEIDDKLDEKSSLVRGTRLTSVTNDMDTLFTPGDYYVSGSNSVANLPYTAGSSIIEVRDGGYNGTYVQTQIASAMAKCIRYTRKFDGTSWGEWNIPIVTINGRFPDNITGNLTLTPTDFTTIENYGSHVTYSEYVRNNESSSPSATLKANAYIEGCMMRMYFTTNKAMTANETYEIAVIPDFCRPNSNHALSFYCSTADGNVYVNTSGKIILIPRSNIGVGYTCYITGFWFSNL